MKILAKFSRREVLVHYFDANKNLDRNISRYFEIDLVVEALDKLYSRPVWQIARAVDRFYKPVRDGIKIDAILGITDVDLP